MHPANPHPANGSGSCDCSGFVAWALGVSRWVRDAAHPLWGRFDGQWLETSAIVLDAARPESGAFALADWKTAQPGMLLCYGDGGTKRQGHVGMVSVVYEGRPEAIVHCSGGNFKKMGDAILETPVEVFWLMNQARVVVPRWVEFA